MCAGKMMNLNSSELNWLGKIVAPRVQEKQTFGLTKMQLLNIILLLSVFVLSSALAQGTLPVDFVK